MLCSVEKSVIQTIEETRNNATKTTEISIENSKRVVLNDNNLSKSCSVTEKSSEICREINNDDDVQLVQSNETFSEKEIIVPPLLSPSSLAPKACHYNNNNNSSNINNNVETENDEQSSTNGVSCTDALSKLMMKTSSSCGSLLNNTYQSTNAVNDVVQNKTASDFLVPYNIINNYFSVGVVSLT